jgi:hypothetical protein
MAAEPPPPLLPHPCPGCRRAGHPAAHPAHAQRGLELDRLLPGCGRRAAVGPATQPCSGWARSAAVHRVRWLRALSLRVLTEGRPAGLSEAGLRRAGVDAGILAVSAMNQWVTPEIDIAFIVGSFGASGGWRRGGGGRVRGGDAWWQGSLPRASLAQPVSGPQAGKLTPNNQP